MNEQGIHDINSGFIPLYNEPKDPKGKPACLRDFKVSKG
jgi:hypothetical protein